MFTTVQWARPHLTSAYGRARVRFEHNWPTVLDRFREGLIVWLPSSGEVGSIEMGNRTSSSAHLKSLQGRAQEQPYGE